MIYYFLAFICYWIFVGLIYKDLKKYRRSLVFIALMPLILIVILRANVGTDTASYLSIVNEISASGSAAGMEYGFVYLVKLLLCFTNNHMFILLLIALFTTAFLIIASRSTDRALFVFAVCIVPIFYLDMTMNGLRYGLSFSCAMYAISKFYKRQLLLSVIWGGVAVVFHISGLFIFFIAAAIADDKDELKSWAILLVVLSLVGIYQLYIPDTLKSLIHGINLEGKYGINLEGKYGINLEGKYGINLEGKYGINLEGKYVIYKQFKSPSWFSGLAPLAISLATLFTLQLSDRKHPMLVVRHTFILLTLVIIMFLIAKFSYAGLRLQSVVLFAMLILFQFKPSFSMVMDKKVKYGLLFVGCLGTLIFIKNALQTEGQGLSPFSPWFVNPYITQLWDFN